ncbi:MAG: FAD-dependent oxidoreductase, partial [Acidobacteriota bacterium]|nr:FAD-dependent oxidoreductase [Acidobacteriota bacterium]
MIEIRIHGRGGQGGVTLAKIIATTRFLQGDSVQAFGLYAAERSGAPLQAFCRYDSKPITNRNLIYEPDHVIVLDPTLVGPGIASGLESGGWILINTPQEPAAFAHDFERHGLATVDATQLARRHELGTRSVPIVNTALAGAVGRMLGFPLEHVHAALEHLGFGGGNLAAASEAFECVDLLKTTGSPTVATSETAALSRERSPSFIDGAGGALPGIKTGLWATQRPQRQQMVPPCNHVCPAGNDVQGFLAALARDEVDEALAILLRTTPLPAVCGRVCPAPCMDNCNRIGLDGAVNVRQLERFAGDHGTATVERSSKRHETITIIGSGPAGLTAAYHLARLGYQVTVFEAASEIGGLLRGGIPEFRLPDEVLDREIARVKDLGVAFETSQPVRRNGLFALAQSQDAVLVATGLQELSSLRLGASDADWIDQGIEFLARSHRGKVRVDSESVVIIGGGNTAIDAARSALRLGAAKVRILYRRTRDEMPAIPEEIEEALAEGVEIEFLTQPISVAGNGSQASVHPSAKITCRRMELGEPDDSGRRSPVEIPGSDFDVWCHRMILALGQSPDLTVFPEGTEVRDNGQLLGLLEKPVFAIGDLATRDGTVAGAIGSGRRSAHHIHETLSGELLGSTAQQEAASRRGRVDVWRDEVIHPEAMKLHLFERRRATTGVEIDAAERRMSFDEVHVGLDNASEAKRCLSCGVCNECDACVTYCPEGVLKRVGHDYVFDSSFCKGCAVCA